MVIILTLLNHPMNLSLIKKYFEPESILDIGANTGQFAQMCSQAFGKAKVLSIEANVLCKDFLAKSNPNYIIRLLDSEPRYRDFFLNKNSLLSTGSSVYRELTEHFDFNNAVSISVKTDTLDHVLPYQVFDLVKLDTQGSEIDIMKGGKRLMQRAKGCIVEVSHKPYNLDAPLSYEVIDYLINNNFALRETLSIESKTHQSDFFFVNKWWEYYEKFIQE